MHKQPLLVAVPFVLGCDLILGIEDREPGARSGAATGTTSGEAPNDSSTASGGEGGVDLVSAASSTSTGATGGGGDEPCSPDLDTDPRHCGACDHDCLGGTCDEGRCQPYALNDPLPEAEHNALVVDDGPAGAIHFARWRDSTHTQEVTPPRIYRMNKSDSVPSTLVSVLASDGWVGGLAVDATNVYFTNYSHGDSWPVRGVYKVPRSGGEPIQLVADDATSRYSGARDLIPEGDELYFSTWYGRTMLGRTSVTGGTVAPLWEIEPPEYELYGEFAIDDTWVYAGWSGGVRRHARDGSATEELYGELDEGVGPGFWEVMACDEGLVYWIDAARHLRRAPADGSGPIEDVAAGAERDILIRDGAVHFIRDGTEVVRIPLDSSAEPEVLAVLPILDVVSHLAADEVSLYWITYDHGVVYRMAL